MALQSLREFAVALAVYSRRKLEHVHRGALLIRCIGDGSMIAAVFGNDNYRCDEKVRREVDLVRQQLRESAIEELGFGVSHDGYSWTLLVKSDTRHYQTAVAKTFQVELLKVFLEDVVWRSWRTACGQSADLPELDVGRNLAESIEG